MIKDLIKEEKELGDTIQIPQKGYMEVKYKVYYKDKHYQSVVAYIGLCNDGNWRAAHHNNSNAKIRIIKRSKGKTPDKAFKKLTKYIKSNGQISSQWI